MNSTLKRKGGAAVAGAAPCSAKFFAAKIAFKIPEKYEVEGHITRAIPDKLVNALMDLFDDCEFESAGICSPPLLIVNTGTATPAWIAKAEKRINAVLQNDPKLSHGRPNAMQIPMLLAQLTAPTPVGSGDLLGCWDIIIRLSLLGGALVCCSIGLAMLINVEAQIRREKQQRNGEPKNAACKPDEHVCLALQPLTGKVCKLGGQDKNLGLLLGNLRTGIDVKAANPVNLFAKLVYSGLNIFRFGHKRKQPNEKVQTRHD